MKNMKKIFALFASFPMVWALSACDPVDEGDRYIEVENPGGEIVGDLVQRTVLLEEFTGQKCSNCPDAHRKIEAFQEMYGENILSVSIHSGNFALEEGTKSFQTFKNEESEAYANQWNVTEYPCGVVDRRFGNVPELPVKWDNMVIEDMKNASSVKMSLEASLNGNDEIDIKTTMEAVNDIEGKLQLLVVEDGIVSVQLDGTTTLKDYVHNNVFRATVNGVGGEPVTLQSKVSKEVKHTIALHDNWNTANLRIIAFIYNDKGVEQACNGAVK